MSLQFEWDEIKAYANEQKHHVTFEEAKTIFDDPLMLTYYDEIHSVQEDRFISIGRSSSGRILLVIHTEREDRIRMISSRTATARERAVYESGA